MDGQQEHKIMRGLRDGQADAWRTLYDAYAERLWWTVARWMGAGSADVADVVQETFLAAARSAGSFDPQRGSLWIWLCGIARNQVALSYRRRQQRSPATGDAFVPTGQTLEEYLESREAAPADALAQAELAALVRRVLSVISVDYGMLLIAFYLDGLTIEQIAQFDNNSLAAVRSKLARARQAFREAYLRISADRSERSARVPHGFQ